MGDGYLLPAAAAVGRLFNPRFDSLLLRDGPQAFIARPQARARQQVAGAEEMYVHQSNAPARKMPALDKLEYLFIVSDNGSREGGKQVENRPAMANVPERDFTQDERVGRNFGLLKSMNKGRYACAQMVHPDRSVDEDHAPCVPRRGIGAICGSLPPRRASLRALSRSIKACSAFRTIAEVSLIPHSSRALAS